MTEPLTHAHIEETLRKAINQQQELTEEYAKLGDDLVTKDAAYKTERPRRE